MAYWLGLLTVRFWPETWTLPPPWAGWAITGLAGLAALLLAWRRPRARLLWPLLPFFGLGVALLIPYHAPLPSPVSQTSHLLRYVGQEVILTATVVRPPDERPSGTYLVVAAEAVLVQGQERPVRGRARLLLLGPPERWPELGYGLRFRAKLRLARIIDFANFSPGAYLFSFRRHLADQGIHLRATLTRPELVLALAEPGGFALWRAVERLRAHCRRLLEAACSPPGAALLRALLLGDGAGLAPEVRRAFQDTGTIHVLVVSGMNLALVALLAQGLLFWLLTRSTRLCLAWNLVLASRLLAVLPVLGYTLLAGLAPPVWRAFLLVGLTGLALAWRRRVEPVSALAGAGLVLTLAWPPALFDLSFQLSFLAVAALLWLSARETTWRPGWTRARGQGRPANLARRLGGHLLGLVLSTVAINLVLAPLLVLAFGRMPLVGLALNLVHVPLYGLLVTPAGLAGLGLSLVHPVLGGWLLALAGWLADLGGRLTLWAGQADWVSLRLVGLSLVEAGLLYLALAGLALLPGRRRAALALLGLALLGGIMDWSYWRQRNADQRLVMTVLDVGQGLAVHLRLPGGESLMVDGGGFLDPGRDIGPAALGPALWSRKIRTVANLALSHPHPDHYRGLEFLLDHFAPRRFIYPGQASADPGLLRLLAKVHSAGLDRPGLAELGEGLTLGPVRLQTLWPPPDFPAKSPPWAANLNDTSLVLKVTFGRISILLPGDVEARSEAALVRRHDQGLIDLSAEVLVVPHHGGRNSSTTPFLARVRPRLALVSAAQGGNASRPHPETLARLLAQGAEVYGTNRWGALTVSSDGQSLALTTSLARPRDEEAEEERQSPFP